MPRDRPIRGADLSTCIASGRTGLQLVPLLVSKLGSHLVRKLQGDASNGWHINCDG